MKCPNCNSVRFGIVTEGDIICGLSLTEIFGFCPDCGYEDYTDIYGNTEIINEGNEVEK